MDRNRGKAVALVQKQLLRMQKIPGPVFDISVKRISSGRSWERPPDCWKRPLLLVGTDNTELDDSIIVIYWAVRHVIFMLFLSQIY